MRVAAGAGDVNGDGWDDVLSGFVAADPGLPSSGTASLQLGSSTGLVPAAAWFAWGEQAASRFGSSVAPAGDVNGDGFDDVLVGAPQHAASLVGEGRAYLFLGSAQGLSRSPAWTADGGQPGAGFGLPVAGAGDVNGDGFDDVLVGAAHFDAGQVDQGRTFLYLGSAAGLAASAAWSADGGLGGAGFGGALTSAGDVDGDGYGDVVVGAAGDDSSAPGAGRAYVYFGSPAGLAPVPAWTALGTQAGGGFGTAVGAADVNGDGFDDVAIGAPGQDGAVLGGGSVAVFLGSALGLATAPAWSADGDRSRAAFGASLAACDLNGDGFGDLVVGAPLDDSSGDDAGRVLAFRGSSLGLLEGPRWSVSGDEPRARYGISVASAGDVDHDGTNDLVVGSRGLAAAPANVHYGSGIDLREHDWMAQGFFARQAFGATVANAGDVDGDGFADVIIVAPDAQGGFHPRDGHVYVYRGSPAGLASAPAWTFASYSSWFFNDLVAASAGDVNGDGFDDVIVGSPLHDDQQVEYYGHAWVFHGSSSGLSTAPDWDVTGDVNFEFFAADVSGAGDVNGDGYDDVVVISGGTDDITGVTYGRIQAFLGSASGLSNAPAWIFWGTPEEDFSLSRAFAAADVNGDGYDDIGLWTLSPSQSHVFLGSASGLQATAAWTMPKRAWPAGDLNADGFADVVVADDLLSNPELREGAVALYLGSPSGLATSASWLAEGNLQNAYFGRVATSAGDVNGDTYGDLIVSAVGTDSVHLYLGEPAGLATSPFRIWRRPGSSHFGESMSTAGDVNGDGRDDWIVGDRGWPATPDAPGAAFVYLGGP